MCNESTRRTENQHFVSKKLNNFPSLLNCGNSAFPGSKYVIFNLFLLYSLSQAVSWEYQQSLANKIQPETVLHMWLSTSGLLSPPPRVAGCLIQGLAPLESVRLPTASRRQSQSLVGGQPGEFGSQASFPLPQGQGTCVLHSTDTTDSRIYMACSLMGWDESFGAGMVHSG